MGNGSFTSGFFEKSPPVVKLHVILGTELVDAVDRAAEFVYM
jgi:hypothetical protein